MKKISIIVNTTRGTFTDMSEQSYDGIEAVHEDTVLMVAHFMEEDPTAANALRDLDLSGATALRCIMKGARTDAATEWTFQDAYNSGIYPAYETLSEGKVTWLVDDAAATLL